MPVLQVADDQVSRESLLDEASASPDGDPVRERALHRAIKEYRYRPLVNLTSGAVAEGIPRT